MSKPTKYGRFKNSELDRLCSALGVKATDGHRFEDCLNEIDALRSSAGGLLVMQRTKWGRCRNTRLPRAKDGFCPDACPPLSMTRCPLLPGSKRKPTKRTKE